jgi:hypothetical protein
MVRTETQRPGASGGQPRLMERVRRAIRARYYSRNPRVPADRAPPAADGLGPAAVILMV